MSREDRIAQVHTAVNALFVFWVSVSALGILLRYCHSWWGIPVGVIMGMLMVLSSGVFIGVALDL